MIEAFLTEYRLYGLVIGLFTFLIIGLFHPVVIKAEYYFGVRSWWFFLVLGLACIFFSVFSDNRVASALFGVTAFTSLWSILELFHQRKRVEKGWFPDNPRKKKSTRDPNR